MLRFIQAIAVSLSLIFSSGCGILVGNTKPVTEKSDDYSVLDLSRDPESEWVPLSSTDPFPANDVKDPNASSDRAWQSKRNSAIVSINTTCRKKITDATVDLSSYSRQLLLGVNDVQLREETELKLQDTPALQTIIEGKLQGEPVRMRAVVLKRAECLYDLVFLGRPGGDKATLQEADFTRFVQSLRIK